MNEQAVRMALLGLMQEGVGDVLDALAYNMSAKGYSRLEVQRFFSDFLAEFGEGLPDRGRDLLGDFVMALAGHCQIDQIPRLFGDPENQDAFLKKVFNETRAQTDGGGKLAKREPSREE